MRYIALLRGVNVGGNNKVSMAELKAAFVAHGFTRVQTYINSGNVLFDCAEADTLKLKQQSEKIIEKAFGLQIPVTVIAGAELNAALKQAPAWWGDDVDIKHNAIFVIPPATPESVIAQVGPAKEEYEKLTWHGSTIFWSAPLATYSRTRWSKVIGTAAYGQLTIRNANTARKLAALSSNELGGCFVK